MWSFLKGDTIVPIVCGGAAAYIIAQYRQHIPPVPGERRADPRLSCVAGEFRDSSSGDPVLGSVADQSSHFSEFEKAPDNPPPNSSPRAPDAASNGEQKKKYRTWEDIRKEASQSSVANNVTL